MSYDHWKTTEPDWGLEPCEHCGEETDCLYRMRRDPKTGKWEEINEAHVESRPGDRRSCYRCCDELEGEPR